MPKCRKCGSEDCLKNGHVFGLQRYKCRNCGYQFTKEAPHGKPIYQKLLVHDLYAYGMSMRKIAKLIGVTAQTVSRWIRAWHTVYKYEHSSDAEIYRVNGNNIGRYAKIASDRDSILLNYDLPSGVKIRVIIQPPENIKKVTL